MEEKMQRTEEMRNFILTQVLDQSARARRKSINIIELYTYCPNVIYEFMYI